MSAAERPRMPSLRNRLLAVVLAGVAVAWIGAAACAFRDALNKTAKFH